jgi:hypothetical protein
MDQKTRHEHRLKYDLDYARLYNGKKYTCCICGKTDMSYGEIRYNNTTLPFNPFQYEDGSWASRSPLFVDFNVDKFAVCGLECRSEFLIRVDFIGSEGNRFPYLDMLMEDVGIPRRFKYATLDTVSDSLNSMLQEWLANKNRKGLLFSGTIGCGKTYVACALATELRKREHTVLFVTAEEFIGSANLIGYNEKSANKFLDKYTRYDYLIIDDMDPSLNISPMAKDLIKRF